MNGNRKLLLIDDHNNNQYLLTIPIHRRRIYFPVDIEENCTIRPQLEYWQRFRTVLMVVDSINYAIHRTSAKKKFNDLICVCIVPRKNFFYKLSPLSNGYCHFKFDLYSFVEIYYESALSGNKRCSDSLCFHSSGSSSKRYRKGHIELFNPMMERFVSFWRAS